MAPLGSSRPSLTYTDQTLEALLPAITPCLNFSNVESGRLVIGHTGNTTQQEFDHLAAQPASRSRDEDFGHRSFSGNGFRRCVELLKLAAGEAPSGLRSIEHRVRENRWDRAHLVESFNLQDA